MKLKMFVIVMCIFVSAFALGQGAQPQGRGQAPQRATAAAPKKIKRDK